MTDEEINQAVTEIKRMLKDRWTYQTGHWINYVEMTLDIVDDLSKKIIEQEKELTAAHNQIAELLLKAGHQAIEIDKINKEKARSKAIRNIINGEF